MLVIGLGVGCGLGVGYGLGVGFYMSLFSLSDLGMSSGLILISFFCLGTSFGLAGLELPNGVSEDVVTLGVVRPIDKPMPA